MSVVTPGDILGRCRALDTRLAEASKAVDAAPPEAIDSAFRDAWRARLRRWQEVRTQCADWSSRMWNFKWGPKLDDWFENQAQWEAEIERRTKQPVTVPAPAQPDEEPALPRQSNLTAIGVGLVAALGLSALLLSRRR